MAKDTKKRSKERSVFIGFHDSPETAAKLDKIAASEDRPVASLLRKIVSEYLEKNR